MSVLNVLDFEDVVPKEVKYLNNFLIATIFKRVKTKMKLINNKN